jgi:hypothetical protein
MLVRYGGYGWCQVWGESERGKKILKISFFHASAHAGEEGELCGLNNTISNYFFIEKKENEFENNPRISYENKNKLT